MDIINLAYQPKKRATRDGALSPFAYARQTAEAIWQSPFYTPCVLGGAVLFLFSGAALQGCVILACIAAVMLLLCSDLLAVLPPFLMVTLLTTQFFENYQVLTDQWWVGAVFLAALCAHLYLYAAPRRGGRFHGSLAAVSLATMLGGVGSISLTEYLSPLSLYYCLGLGALMLLTYQIVRTQLGRSRRYGVVHRFAGILYAAGLFAGIVVLQVYVTQLPTFLSDFATLYFPYRNFCSTVLLLSMPMSCLLIVDRKIHWLGLLFQYAMLLFSGSRSGLLFGSLSLIGCLVWLYRNDHRYRRVYRTCLRWGGIPVLLALVVMGKALFASRLVDGELISFTESRVTFFLQALRDFSSNPLFGRGLGYLGNSDIFIGVSGSIVWYHNMIAQVLGSMGLLGAVAYGWQIRDRLLLLVRKRCPLTAIFAISYAGMLLISMTNPGEFCPLPNELLVVILFAMLEELPDQAAVMAAQKAAASRPVLRPLAVPVYARRRYEMEQRPTAAPCLRISSGDGLSRREIC